MTTVAYRDGTVAFDSRFSYGAVYVSSYDSQKGQVAGNYLCAIAGHVFVREALNRWLADGADSSEVPKVLIDNDDEFTALIINRQGEAFTFEKGYLVPVGAEYFAIGSGRQFAMGAMAHGACAFAAVEAAAQHDSDSGGPVHQLHISQIPN